MMEPASSYDFNAAIDAYSHSTGNRADRLSEFCRSRGLADAEREIKCAIDTIQGELLDIVRKVTRDAGPLPAAQIERIARAHCLDHYPAVDARGIGSLLRWLVWMAWHEGCLR